LNIEVRPTLPPGFQSCGGEKGGASAVPPPSVGEAWRTRFGVMSAEEASGVPPGSRGMPYPGQKPISEVEALTQKIKSATDGGSVDEATKAALDAAAEREAAEKEAKKGCELRRFAGSFMPHVPTHFFLAATLQPIPRCTPSLTTLYYPNFSTFHIIQQGWRSCSHI
jgi:hypothetical protein